MSCYVLYYDHAKREHPSCDLPVPLWNCLGIGVNSIKETLQNILINIKNKNYSKNFCCSTVRQFKHANRGENLITLER